MGGGSAMNDETDKDAEVMDEWASALAEQETDSSVVEAEERAKESASKGTSYQKAAMQSLQDEHRPLISEDVNLDVILDVPVTISLEIGRTRISIRNLLQLNQGSVVELDRLAGEPLDVMVNGTLIAHGEVVVVNEKYGIRLTDVISPVERVKKLK